MVIDIALFLVTEKEDDFFDFWNFDLDKCNLRKIEVNSFFYLHFLGSFAQWWVEDHDSISCSVRHFVSRHHRFVALERSSIPLRRQLLIIITKLTFFLILLSSFVNELFS